MTESEVRELLKLIKNHNLYCNLELETDDTYLSEDTLRYSFCSAHIYTDKDKDIVIITMRLDINPENQTYYLDDTSGRFSEETQKLALPVCRYCKDLIARYV